METLEGGGNWSAVWKGVEIRILSNGTFRATIDGEYVEAASVAAIRTKINDSVKLPRVNLEVRQLVSDYSREAGGPNRLEKAIVTHLNANRKVVLADGSAEGRFGSLSGLFWPDAALEAEYHAKADAFFAANAAARAARDTRDAVLARMRSVTVQEIVEAQKAVK